MPRVRPLPLFVAAAGVAAVLLAVFVYPHVGSGTQCEGIGFGCSPERELDTAFVLFVYVVGILTTASWSARGGRVQAATLAVGFVCTLALTGAAFAVQRPDYDYARGDLEAGVERWESVIDAGRRAARPGTPLARALASLHRTGPEPCRDAYGRATGGARYRWSSPTTPHDEPVAATTAPALTAWARELRLQRLPAVLERSSSYLNLGYADPPARGVPRAANGAVLSVSAYQGRPGLEITASTGCHRV